MWKHLEAPTYTVSYNANGGTGAPAAQTVTEGGSIYLSSTCPSRSGYLFLGWNTDPNLDWAMYAPEGEFGCDHDLTLYAIWKRIYAFGVNATLNGEYRDTLDGFGTFDINIDNSIVRYDQTDFMEYNIGEGSTYSVNNMQSVAGYQYVGSAYYNGMVYEDTYITLPFVSVYNISYDANGGTGAPAAQSWTHGSGVTLSSTVPTREGYSFVCWSPRADGTAERFNPGETIYYNYHLLVYAVWEANGCTISYNANGGTGAPAAQTKQAGESIVLRTERPTREGYNFLGWNPDPNATAPSVNPGDTVYYDTVTLYAVWIPVGGLDVNGTLNGEARNNMDGILTFDIYFDGISVGNDVSDYANLQISNGSQYYITDIKAKDGYAYTGPTSFSGSVQAGETTSINLTAASIYNITYDGNGGIGVPAAQSWTHGSGVTLSSAVPTCMNYTFVCWSPRRDGTAERFNPGDTIYYNYNLTLYAVWTETYPAPVFDTPMRDDDSTTPSIFTSLSYTEENKPQAWGLEIGTSADTMASCFTHNITADEYVNDHVELGIGLWGAIYPMEVGTTYYYRFWTYDTYGRYTYSVVQHFTAQENTPLSFDGLSRSDNSTNPSFGATLHYCAGTTPLRWGLELGTDSSLSTVYEKQIYTVELNSSYTMNLNVALSSDLFTLTPGTTYYYRFRAYDTHDRTVYSDTQSFTVDEPLETCTLTFDANGGSCAESSRTVRKNEPMGTLPTPTRSGYTFVGWYDGSTRITESSVFHQDRSITLTAHWEKKPTVAPSSVWIQWSTGPVERSTTIDMNEESELTMEGSVTPYEADQTLLWSSSNSAVATTSGNRVRLLAPGSVTITATTADGSRSKSLTLTVVRGISGLSPLSQSGVTSTSVALEGRESCAFIAGSTLTLSARLLGNPTDTAVVWVLDESSQGLAELKAGKVAAQNGVPTATAGVKTKNLSEPVQLHALCRSAADASICADFYFWVLPKATNITVWDFPGVINGITYTVDLNNEDELDEGSLYFMPEVYPLGASSRLNWTSSDTKNTLGTLRVESDGELCYTPSGKTGSVTLTGKTTDGSNISVKFTLKFVRYAPEITIYGAPETMMGGNSVTLSTDIARYSGLSDKKVTWRIPEEYAALAAISAAGKLTAKNVVERSTITVYAYTAGQAYDSVNITLLPKQEKGVVLKLDGSVVNGLTKKVKLSEGSVGLDAYAVGLGSSYVSLSTKGSSAVLSGGQLLLRGSGKTVVTAVGPDGRTKASFTLQVVADAVDMEILTPNGSSLAAGKSLKLSAALYSAVDGVKVDNSKIDWVLSPEDAAYATLKNGTLTASKNLSARRSIYVTARAAENHWLEYSVEIVLMPLASAVSIEPTAATESISVRGLRLFAHVAPLAANQGVKWTSSSKLFPIDANGVITPDPNAKAATVTFTATATDGSGKKATVKIQFVRYMEEEDISISDNLFLRAGASLTLSATVNKAVTNPKLMWVMEDSPYATLKGNKLIAAKNLSVPVTVTVTACALDGSLVEKDVSVTIYP